jgi:hypothetical protein
MNRAERASWLKVEFREKNRCLHNPQILLLDPVDVPGYIEAGRSRELPFRGLEGFRLLGSSGVQPVAQFSRHLSDFGMDESLFLPAIEGLLAEARAEGIVFEVIFDLSLTADEKERIRLLTSGIHYDPDR